ncbi:unnamed protein product, partial [Alopecurus aequalis]
MRRTIPNELHPEILEHLPPRPQSLAYASTVCRAWRRIVNDPGFLRRYRERHGTPLTMGFFHNSGAIPRPFVHVSGFASFSFKRPNDNEHSWKFMDCRHGRILLHDEATANDRCFLVLHPMTGYCHPLIILPNKFEQHCLMKNTNAALICATGCDNDNHYMGCKPTSPFRMAVVRSDSQGRVYAEVFSSLTGQWSPKATWVDLPPACDVRAEPCAIVGDTMYQPLYDYRVLAYDIGKGTLTAFERPRGGNVRLMKADGGARLGLAAAQGLTVRLWVWDTDGGWVWRKTVDLGEVVAGLSTTPLPWPFPSTDPRFTVMPPVKIIGVAEEGDVLFLWTMMGVFMMCPKSLELRKVHETATGMEIVYPYAAFYLGPA